MTGLILRYLLEGSRLLLAIYFCCAFLAVLTLYAKRWLSTRLKFGITALRLPKPELKLDLVRSPIRRKPVKARW
jgi:hypothetical protein